jgi:hypothetical protein
MSSPREKIRLITVLDRRKAVSDYNQPRHRTEKISSNGNGRARAD